jgi:hypothetical protein
MEIGEVELRLTPLRPSFLRIQARREYPPTPPLPPRVLAAIWTALHDCLLYFCVCSFLFRAWFASHFTTSSSKLAHYEHTRDPAQGHERVERIKMCKLPRMNPNGRTLVLAALSLNGAGPTPGFRSAP